MSLLLYTCRPLMSLQKLRVVHAGNMHCDFGHPNTSACTKVGLKREIMQSGIKHKAIERLQL